jgi:membrane glycosyltransferase
MSLMLGQTAVATYFMSKVLPYQGKDEWEWALLALFALLFCWVSAGFWTAMAGFLVLLRGGDRYAISSDVDQSAPIPINARTAIVMPICNEDIVRVMAGLRATYESVEKTGELRHFDFFILSDTSESDTRTAEIAKWAELCKAVNGFGRIFYRHRKRRVKRKSGNIDDFCRRWGKNYRYMLVLDADSVMSGACLTRLVRMMEAHPDAGIIQSAPIAAGRDTLYARIQQFSTRVYGPLFTAGLHYWQLGESHYWGHNAIIRMAPLMKHCVLSPLPGRGSLAGEILSHDFVEAALMRRAGWRVWIAYDIEGSYEEMPPNLLDELKRDRRWCHGNLMNFRLFTARGMHPVHRAVFATGVMAYLSAPLWFLFLALSTAVLAMHVLVEPQYFQQPNQLFPIWPQWHPEKAIALFTATATLLFLPKILSVALAMRNARQFGGALHLTASMVLEILFSMLLAPVRMLFHTKFVSAAFLGIALHWKSPPRDDSETHWGEAFGKHGLHAVLGMAWGGFVYWLNPSLLPWVLPIAAGLILSPLISAFSSRVTLGRSFRRARLFTIPEELSPPQELEETVKYVRSATPLPSFMDAVTDPSLNALACAAAKYRPQSGLFEKLDADRLLQEDAALGEMQKNAVLNDAFCLAKLHQHAWTSSFVLEKHAGEGGPAAANL